MWYDRFFRDWETFQLPEDEKELRDRIANILADGKQYETKLFTTECGERFTALRVAS